MPYPTQARKLGGFRPAPISSARRVPFQVTPNDTQRHSTTVQRPDLGQSGPFGRPELCHPTRPNCAKAPVRPEPVVQPALRLGHGALDALDLPERSGPVLPLPCLTKQEFLIFHCALHSRDEHWKEKNAHNQETQEYRVRPRDSSSSSYKLRCGQQIQPRRRLWSAPRAAVRTWAISPSSFPYASFSSLKKQLHASPLVPFAPNARKLSCSPGDATSNSSTTNSSTIPTPDPSALTAVP